MAYADGRAAQAEEILLRAVGEPLADATSALPWLILFDLYRVQERWADFDALGERYGAIFGKPAPDYLPDDELPRDLPALLRRGEAGYCALRGELGEPSAAQIEAIGRAAQTQSVVHVDASRVDRLTPQGCALLSRQLQAAVSGGTGVLVSGTARLERLLRRTGCDAEGRTLLAPPARPVPGARTAEGVRKYRPGVCAGGRSRAAPMGTAPRAGRTAADTGGAPR
ncbi:MAG TPA: hypothetical protein VNM24_17275 [Burkholderiales bacterium]|nr:hypothetical protein [Burkholderiales bacterium]